MAAIVAKTFLLFALCVDSRRVSFLNRAGDVPADIEDFASLPVQALTSDAYTMKAVQAHDGDHHDDHHEHHHQDHHEGAHRAEELNHKVEEAESELATALRAVQTAELKRAASMQIEKLQALFMEKFHEISEIERGYVAQALATAATNTSEQCKHEIAVIHGTTSPAPAPGPAPAGAASPFPAVDAPKNGTALAQLASKSKWDILEGWFGDEKAKEGCHNEVPEGSSDSHDYHCADYDGFTWFCGLYDDDDFTADQMCCVCGGGRAHKPVCKGIDECGCDQAKEGGGFCNFDHLSSLGLACEACDAYSVPADCETDGLSAEGVVDCKCQCFDKVGLPAPETYEYPEEASDMERVLQDHAARNQDTFVDAMENVIVAELKRTMILAFWNTARFADMDLMGIQREKMMYYDYYNNAHYYRDQLPAGVRHLHNNDMHLLMAQLRNQSVPSASPSASPAASPSSEPSPAIDTPYLWPPVDLAKELEDHATKTENTFLDACENLIVSEFKRIIHHGLLRLDTLKDQSVNSWPSKDKKRCANDVFSAFNDMNHYRMAHPLMGGSEHDKRWTDMENVALGRLSSLEDAPLPNNLTDLRNERHRKSSASHHAADDHHHDDHHHDEHHHDDHHHDDHHHDEHHEDIMMKITSSALRRMHNFIGEHWSAIARMQMDAITHDTSKQ